MDQRNSASLLLPHKKLLGMPAVCGQIETGLRLAGIEQIESTGSIEKQHVRLRGGDEKLWKVVERDGKRWKATEAKESDGRETTHS